MFEKSKMNYLEMYYPSCFIKFFGIEIKNDTDTSILNSLLDKMIGYIKFDVSPNNNQCLVIFRGEKMYNTFIMDLNNNNIAYKLFKFAEQYAKMNDAKIVKSDTEVSNTKMNNLFNKLGFAYIGKFSYDDYPGNYNYYEKRL